MGQGVYIGCLGASAHQILLLILMDVHIDWPHHLVVPVGLGALPLSVSVRELVSISASVR
jgi:hypothetical protein